MTVEVESSDSQTTAEEKPSLFTKIKDRVRGSLSAMNRHCEEIEKAKEACDRENLKKHGKDWVNRCCG